MQKMVVFRLNRECREIAVNPDKVLYVCHYETGASALHFGKECFVRVQGDLADVVHSLESAASARIDGPARDHESLQAHRRRFLQRRSREQGVDLAELIPIETEACQEVVVDRASFLHDATIERSAPCGERAVRR